MHILQLCPYLYPALSYGGPARYVYDLSLELAKTQKVTILTADSFNLQRRLHPSEQITLSSSLRVRYFRNISNRLAFRVKLFSHFGIVLWFLRSRKSIDIIHAHDVFIFPQLIVLVLAKIFNIPYVITPHGVLDKERFKSKSFLKAVLLLLVIPVFKWARAVIAINPDEHTQLQQLLNRDVILSSTGIPVSIATRRVRNHGRPLHFVYIGRVHPQKGVIEFLQAAKEVESPIQITIAGPDDGVGDLLDAKLRALSQHIVNRIGYVDDQKKSKLLASADVFVYPSHSEGFSIAILEAMSAGLPVLISDRCNFPEIKTQQAGWIARKDYLVEDLHNLIITIIDHSDDIHNFGKRGRILARANYSIEKIARDRVMLYSQLVM